MVGCNQSPQSTPPVKRGPSQASQEWAKISNGFVESYFRAQPFFAAQAGRHEYDGQLPDLSEHGIRREIARLHDARDQLAGVDPAPLEPSERFDRDYLLSVVDRDLFYLEKVRYPFSNPYWYLSQHRSGHVPDSQLCAARRAHEGVHQVRAGNPENGE